MKDVEYMQRAIELANLAEREGNLPVGALLVHGSEVVSEGRSHIWVPVFDPTRHAEMEAIRMAPRNRWDHPGEMTLYTMLEPCLMCAGAILLHRIGRVVYGSSDVYAGIGAAVAHLPPFFRERFEAVEWVGPLMPEVCDPLFVRLKKIENKRRFSAQNS